MLYRSSLSYYIRITLTLTGVVLLSGCQLENELYSHGLSKDLADAPKLVGLLQSSGVMDSEGGLIQVFLYNSQGERVRMDATPLIHDGKQIDCWSWRKTQGFYLSPDKFRDQVNAAAKDYPPDSYLMPGSLGKFLGAVYEATL